MKKIYLVVSIVTCFVGLPLFGMQKIGSSRVHPNEGYSHSHAKVAEAQSRLKKMIADKSVINVPTAKIMRRPNQKPIMKPTVHHNGDPRAKRCLKFSQNDQSNDPQFDEDGAVNFFYRKKEAKSAVLFMGQYEKIDQQLRENGHDPQLCNQRMIVKDHLKLLGIMTIRPTSSQVNEEICDMGMVDVYDKWDKEKKDSQV